MGRGYSNAQRLAFRTHRAARRYPGLLCDRPVTVANDAPNEVRSCPFEKESDLKQFLEKVCIGAVILRTEDKLLKKTDFPDDLAAPDLNSWKRYKVANEGRPGFYCLRPDHWRQSVLVHRGRAPKPRSKRAAVGKGQWSAELAEITRAWFIEHGSVRNLLVPLPDFRGDAGFWSTYPALRAQSMSFQDMANGSLFLSRPDLAWGFYGHRLDLYRRVQPHRGFDIRRAENAGRAGNRPMNCFR